MIRTVHNFFRMIIKKNCRVKKVTRKDYKCVAYRVLVGKLERVCPFNTISAGNIIILEHTQIWKHIYLYTHMYMYMYMSVAVAARSEESVCGHSSAEIVGSKFASGTDVCLL